VYQRRQLPVQLTDGVNMVLYYIPGFHNKELIYKVRALCEKCGIEFSILVKHKNELTETQNLMRIGEAGRYCMKCAIDEEIKKTDS
jgi:hypothetical protein